MTNDPQPQTVTPERQIAAQRIGLVFSQTHGYLQSLQSKDDKGEPILTAMLQNAHCRLEEAQFWAIKHALMFGVPTIAPPAANDAPPPAPSPNQPTGDSQSADEQGAPSSMSDADVGRALHDDNVVN